MSIVKYDIVNRPEQMQSGAYRGEILYVLGSGEESSLWGAAISRADPEFANWCKKELSRRSRL
jgi:hypothetical protein